MKTTITAAYAAPAANTSPILPLLIVDIEITKTVEAAKMIMNLKSVLRTILSPIIGVRSRKIAITAMMTLVVSRTIARYTITGSD
jgi:hypothetical protein